MRWLGTGRCGVEAFLGEGDESRTGIGSLLTPWTPESVPRDPEAEIRRGLERALARLRREFSAARLVAQYDPGDAEQSYVLTVRRRGPAPRIPDGAAVKGWPVTVKPELAVPIDPSKEAICQMGPLSFEAMTSFFALAVTLEKEGVAVRRRFVFNLPMEGAPADRRERLLRSLLRDRDQVVRLLWILLCQEEISVQDLAGIGSGTGSDGWRAADPNCTPLLEAMLEALDKNPRALDEVERLVKDLSRTPEGRALLPEGFDDVFAPIAAVRRHLAR